MRCPICDGHVEVTNTVMVDANGKKTKKHPAKIKRYRKCTNCKKYNPVTFEDIPKTGVPKEEFSDPDRVEMPVS